MPFLDVIHLFFEPAATVEDEASIFGKEWRMTLQYILHQPGLQAAHKSRLGAENDTWVFLTWATEADRHHFYYQTTGFGFLSNHMKNAPPVFFLGDDVYEEFDDQKEWALDILYEEARDVTRTRDRKQKLDTQEEQIPELLSLHRFVAQQGTRTLEQLYQGNASDIAFIGIIATDLHVEKSLTSGFKWKRYQVRLARCEQTQYPNHPHTETPVDIADLTSKHPWEYGVLPYDDSEYSNTATPMSLAFRPMSTLHMANKYLREPGRRQMAETEASEEYAFCKISVLSITTGSSQRDDSFIEALQAEMALQKGLEGLREIRAIRRFARRDEHKSIHFLCTWNTCADLTKWWQDYTINGQTRPGIIANIDYTWSSDKLGWSNLEWDNMPLTPDKQTWQKVDKILEIVEFAFAEHLTAAGRGAFESRLYALINTMSSCWSGDVDERPVVYVEDPVWTDAKDAPSSCLLFLAWDGFEQRAAWLRNFVADSFTWTGYIAHALGLICSRVESGTYEMETLFVWQPTYEGLAKDNIDDDDSDGDMGF